MQKAASGESGVDGDDAITSLLEVYPRLHRVQQSNVVTALTI